MVKIMEDKYGKPQRIWELDRGMISEDNIAFLRARGAYYIVGGAKAQLKKFETQLLEQADWDRSPTGSGSQLAAHPDGASSEQYILCRSSARRQKRGGDDRTGAPAAASPAGQNPHLIATPAGRRRRQGGTADRPLAGEIFQRRENSSK